MVSIIMNNSRAVATQTAAATEIIEEGKSTFQVACWSKSKPTTFLMMRVIAIKVAFTCATHYYSYFFTATAVIIILLL